MAIQVDLQESQYGIPFAGAYFRIVTASVSRRNGTPAQFVVMIDVAGYASVPQNDNTRDVDSRRYYAPLNDIEGQPGSTFMAKCYSWVMSQSDMSGSVAV